MVGEERQRVVHRLTRDRADVVTNVDRDVVGARMRKVGDGTQHGEALRCDLEASFSEDVGRLAHASTIHRFWTLSKCFSVPEKAFGCHAGS